MLDCQSAGYTTSLKKKTFFRQPLLQACDVGNVAGLPPQTLCCHAICVSILQRLRYKPDTVLRELRTLRRAHSALSNTEWKAFAEADFKRRRIESDAQLSLPSHGGFRHGERIEPEESDDDEKEDEAEERHMGKTVLDEFPDGVAAVGVRAADLILMTCQIFQMASWFPHTHINKSLQTEKYARRFLLAVGFGGVGTASFMRQLCLRALQLVGRCLNKVADVGTGAREVSCSILNSKAKTPPGAAMEDMASALMPIMAFLVSYHLGAEWVVLINFQTVQGLMCENRKWIHRGDNEDSNQRRPGWPERKAVYRAWLEIFSRD